MADRDPARSSGRVMFVGALREAEPVFRILLASTAEVVGLVTLEAALGEHTPRFVDLAAEAQVHGIPVLRAADGDVRGLVPQMRGLAPTLVVVAGWTWPLPSDLLVMPRHGAVGFHASLLPRNRGSAPVNWALIRGDTLTGNTMVMLVPGIANGDIVDQREITIGPEDTCGTVYDKVADSGARMLREKLPALLAGTAPRRRQVVHHFDRKLPVRTADMNITSFDRTSVEIFNWVRALTRPCTGAFTHMWGERVTLWSAEALPDRRTLAPPGTVLGVDRDGVVVTTSTGAVRLLEVQAEDGPPETAASWFARKELQPGCVFEAVDAETAAWALGKGERPARRTDADPAHSERRRKGPTP
ncbi:MAG: methionyl-tRNA formyltransferase [Nocardioides sp.]